jgi:hypothetical protein
MAGAIRRRPGWWPGAWPAAGVSHLYLAFATYTAAVAALSGGDEAAWGRWATGGYLLAAVLAHRSRPRPALLVALAGGVAAPLAWLMLRLPPTPDVSVVARSAALLLQHGDPYLPTGSLATWLSYNPYLPAMAVFGLPHALGLPGVAGDPRPWLLAATMATGAAAVRVAGRRGALWAAAFACASPLLALPLTLGGTDPPVLALLCLALACLARAPAVTAGAAGGPAAWRRRWPTAWPVAAGVAAGVACALKGTAWPALPVMLALLAKRERPRAAAGFGLAAAGTALTLVVVAAPALLARPGALLDNTVLYPLGLTRQLTPAASPLPGHLLAAAGGAGRAAALALLGLAGLAVAGSLLVRPPADCPAAIRRLALGLVLLFALSPASRFGYFGYPAALLCWLAWTASGRKDGGGAAAGRALRRDLGTQPVPLAQAGRVSGPNASSSSALASGGAPATPVPGAAADAVPAAGAVLAGAASATPADGAA